jgi:hypothetical protein
VLHDIRGNSLDAPTIFFWLSGWDSFGKLHSQGQPVICFGDTHSAAAVQDCEGSIAVLVANINMATSGNSHHLNITWLIFEHHPFSSLGRHVIFL